MKQRSKTKTFPSWKNLKERIKNKADKQNGEILKRALSIVDNANIDNGIVELRYIDPRNLRKVREIRQDKSQNLDMMQSIPNQKITEYFLFSNKGSTSKDEDRRKTGDKFFEFNCSK